MRIQFYYGLNFNCGHHSEKYGKDDMKPAKVIVINAIQILDYNADLKFNKEEKDYICSKI